MNEEKKICPFIKDGDEVHFWHVDCKKEKCMAWGEIRKFYNPTKGYHIYDFGCKLIERGKHE